MTDSADLDVRSSFQVVRFRSGLEEAVTVDVASEVPLTIVANNKEVATLASTPSGLRELAYGFLFTSGIIRNADEVRSFRLDSRKWRVDLELEKEVDSDLLGRRVYTSGCGKGVMYASVNDLSTRHPLVNSNRFPIGQFVEAVRWLQSYSELHKSTGGVHTAGLCENGNEPVLAFEDIGRHNAVDKVIGAGLLHGAPFSSSILICSGRTSSEILLKSKKAEIPVIISRGAPTHQTVLMAGDFGITVAGFARGSGFTAYTHPERILHS